MGIVDEAIEHGVGIGGISNEQMPLVHGELAGDDGGAMTVAIFEDFQEVVTGAGIERLEPPIIEDQQIDTAKAAQQAWVTTVAAGERQIVEQARDALIEHGAIVATGLVAERRGEPTLADACRAADQEIDVVVDPTALDKLGEQRAVETARGAVVDVLDACLLAQLGVAQASGEPFVVPQRGFTFEQQSKPFGVTEAASLTGGFDVGEGLGHAVEAEGVEAVEGRMGEQGMVS